MAGRLLMYSYDSFFYDTFEEASSVEVLEEVVKLSSFVAPVHVSHFKK